MSRGLGLCILRGPTTLKLRGLRPTVTLGPTVRLTAFQKHRGLGDLVRQGLIHGIRQRPALQLQGARPRYRISRATACRSAAPPPHHLTTTSAVHASACGSSQLAVYFWQPRVRLMPEEERREYGEIYS